MEKQQGQAVRRRERLFEADEEADNHPKCLIYCTRLQTLYPLLQQIYLSSYTIYTKGTKQSTSSPFDIPQQKRLLKNTFWSYIYASIYIYRVSANPVSWLSHWSEPTADSGLQWVHQKVDLDLRCVLHLHNVPVFLKDYHRGRARRLANDRRAPDNLKRAEDSTERMSVYMYIYISRYTTSRWQKSFRASGIP